MNDADWLKIKEIFNQMLDLPEAEREKVLANCDEFVQLEVHSLLDSMDDSAKFIDEPAVVEFGLSEDRLLGKKIDEYRIIKEIGAGGMGKVYLAQREGFEQKFALKLIKRGMDTDAVLQRFVRERQILSRLEHPNIARLLNVGSTDNDLPYFVMEYVEGEPITKFCESHQLNANERLEIFQKVCFAVKYAHQNLIVHRDLKPSNILVTNEGTPKLLDFGIAKLLNAEDFENTATQARILTPEYASPEQLNNLPITTATDVYSLGVVLHEILNGKRPSAVVSGQWRDSGAVRDTDKNQIETQAAKNQKSKIKNQKSNGDLDNIIHKSLHEESIRRYQTVQEFSEDLRRYVVGLPVTATADTTFYRFSKLVGRNKIGTAVACLILLLSSLAIWQGLVANRERVKAEQRFEQVRKLANIILFEYHDGIEKLPGATSIREKMVSDSREFLDNLSAEEGGNVDLQRDIVKAYQKVGDIQGGGNTGNVGKTNEALANYQKAFSIQEKIVSANSANITDQKMLGDLHINIGQLQQDIGELHNTEKSFQSALDIYSNLQTQSPNDFKIRGAVAKTFWNIAQLKATQNEFDRGLENYQKAVEIYQQLAIDDESYKNGYLRNVALTNKNMGSIWQQRGEPAKALQLFQKSLEIDLENVKNSPNDVSAELDLSFTYGSVASASRDLKDFQAALENYQNAIEIREKVFNADNKNVFAENALARGYQELGKTFLQKNDFAKAAEHLVKSQSIYQKSSDSDGENLDKKLRLAESLALLGYVHGLSLKIDKANEFYKKSLTIYANLIKQEKLSTLKKRRFVSIYIDYGEVLLKNKLTTEALVSLNKAQDLLADEKVGKDAKEELAKLEKLLDEAKRK